MFEVDAVSRVSVKSLLAVLEVSRCTFSEVVSFLNRLYQLLSPKLDTTSAAVWFLEEI